MSWRLLLLGIAATIARGAEPGGLSALYVVSDSFSDNGAQFFYRVIDVHADGPDSVVRYARIAPINMYCPRMIVQAAETRLRKISPAGLVKDNNPCTVRPRALQAAVKKYAQRVGVFETISYGIVAQCGPSSVSFALPIPEKVDLERLRQAHPEMARLWELASELTAPAFGTKDIFHDRTGDDDLALQRAGEKLVPELVSGQYDAGLAAAVKEGVGTWRSPTFRSLLGSYRGPVSATEADAGLVPQLLNAQAYRFSHFVAPKYLRLAMLARVQGKVDLQLNVDPATGEVRRVVATSGHPLLKPNAIDAAKQWRFLPNFADAGTVNVTLDFALRCP
jgi:TonB family protein